MRYVRTILLPLFLSGPVMAGPLTSVGGRCEPLPVPACLAVHTLLSKPLTLSAHGRPLGEVLAQVATQCGVRLAACPELAAQRVSVAAAGVPAARVLADLADVVGHCRRPGVEVEWKALGSGALLDLTSAGVAAGRDPDGRAQRTASAWLTDLRSYAAASPAQRQAMRSPCPTIAEHQAMGDDLGIGRLLGKLAGYSADEYRELLQTGRDPSRDAPKDARTVHLAPGDRPGVFEFVVPVTASEDMAIMLDTLGTANERSTSRTEQARDLASGPSVTIASPTTSDGKDREVTAIEALDLWSRATRRSLCAEVFLTGKRSLHLYSGPPDQVLTGLCRRFGLDWRRAGGTTVVWSKAWAFDRKADVSEEQFVRLRAGRAPGARPSLPMLLAAWRMGPARRLTAARGLGVADPENVMSRPVIIAMASLPPYIGAGACRSGRSVLEMPDGAVLDVVRQLAGRAPRGALTVRARDFASPGYPAGCEVEITDETGRVRIGARLPGVPLK